jgi:hypothetical protein
LKYSLLLYFKKKLLIGVLLLIQFSSFSQLESVVINKETKEIVPFASIYIKNEKKGTSSNLDGSFEIIVKQFDTLIISSIGFKGIEIVVKNVKDTIFLVPDILRMQEVKIQSNRKFLLFPKRNTIGEVRSSYFDDSHWIGSGGIPYDIARFFIFKEEYANTRFVESVTFETFSDIDDVAFALNFYRKGKNGFPAELINKRSIIGTAKKGRNKTKVELKDEKVYLPKDGLFVSVKFLIIESNRVLLENLLEFYGNQYKFKYAPYFSLVEVDNEHYFSFNIKNQKWTEHISEDRILECQIVLTE